MKKLLILLVSIFTIGLCINGQENVNNSSSGNSLIDKEIRGVICDIENKNFSKAQIVLEKILQKEPQNVYAQRLLPGVLANQIKIDDRSPENLAKIKIAIEKFDKFSANSGVSFEDKIAINDFIISLIQMFDDSQKESEFLSRSEDQKTSPEIRSRYFTALAAHYYKCSNNISESVKKIEKQNGQEIYVFYKPKKNQEFDKLKQCASKGIDFIYKAVALDSESEIVWSYKGSLLIQQMRIAEMEANTQEKERLNREREAVVEKFISLSNKRRELNDNPLIEIPEEKTNLDESIKELTVYKRERPIPELVKEIYIPVDKTFISPIPLEDSQNDSDLNPKNNKQNVKTVWKTFSPKNDEFTAELPDNTTTNSSGEIVIYSASIDDLNFMILSQPKIEVQTSTIDDAVLNILARSFLIPTGNLLMGDITAGNFEAKLVKKERFTGFPAKFYNYTLTSCTGKKVGIIILMIGKTRNFAIQLNGADEKAPQVQRFLKSWKIKDK